MEPASSTLTNQSLFLQLGKGEFIPLNQGEPAGLDQNIIALYQNFITAFCTAASGVIGFSLYEALGHPLESSKPPW